MFKSSISYFGRAGVKETFNFLLIHIEILNTMGHGWRNMEEFEKESGRVNETFCDTPWQTDRRSETEMSALTHQADGSRSTCGKTTCAYYVFAMHTLWIRLPYS